MNAARGAFLAARRKPKLPYDAEVEYLESTGTQYADLGAIVPPNADFEFTGSIVSDKVNGCIFGESTVFPWNPTNSAYSLVTTSNGRVYLRYGNNTTTAIGLTTIGLEQTFTASLSGTSFQINGQTVATITRVSSFSQDVASMGLFRRNILLATGNSTYSAIRINEIKFGSLYELIPVRFTNEQGVSEGAMYDRANPTGGMNPDGSARTDGLYRNRGTGAFLYGADKVA